MTTETFDTIRQWAEDTFGPITTYRAFTRASEEYHELWDAVEDHNYLEIPNEAADVIICLLRIPGAAAEVQRKMQVNRQRTWKLMGDGTGYHIKT